MIKQTTAPESSAASSDLADHAGPANLTKAAPMVASVTAVAVGVAMAATYRTIPDNMIKTPAFITRAAITRMHLPTMGTQSRLPKISLR